jgi:DNA-binding NarL/FixJ family response regulator
MSLWRRLLQALKGRDAQRAYELDQPLVEVLQRFAEAEKRPREEVAADLLSAALLKRQQAEEYLRTWRALSTREQQVTALTCLNYTNPQIASRLYLSPDTVKSHVRNVLRKFNVRSKAELRQALSEWDFSEWK